jgi:hypothetical protein
MRGKGRISSGISDWFTDRLFVCVSYVCELALLKFDVREDQKTTDSAPMPAIYL